MSWDLLQPLAQPLEAFLNSSIQLFPNLVASVILLAIGGVIGTIVGRVTRELMIRFKVDHYIAKGEPMFKLSDIFPIIIEWSVYLVFIQAAVQTLGITALVTFVSTLLGFMPGLIEAVIIVVVGYVFAEYVRKETVKSKIPYSDIMSNIVFWLMIYIAVALALPLVGINAALVNNILLIIVGSFGIGIAIAIGLGLKDVVAEIARKNIKKIIK